MAYIYIGTPDTDCKCSEYSGNGKPTPKPSRKYPYGSVWECPKCGAHWEKVKGKEFVKLTDEEKLVWNETTGQYTKPD